MIGFLKAQLISIIDALCLTAVEIGVYICHSSSFVIKQIMPIVASESLLRETKKSSNKMLFPVGIDPRP